MNPHIKESGIILRCTCQRFFGGHPPRTVGYVRDPRCAFHGTSAPDRCGCGELSPCIEHETTAGMRDAMRALMQLHPRQRARVLCWFCPDCSEHMPPGGGHKCDS